MPPWQACSRDYFHHALQSKLSSSSLYLVHAQISGSAWAATFQCRLIRIMNGIPTNLSTRMLYVTMFVVASRWRKIACSRPQANFGWSGSQLFRLAYSLQTPRNVWNGHAHCAMLSCSCLPYVKQDIAGGQPLNSPRGGGGGGGGDDDFREIQAPSGALEWFSVWQGGWCGLKLRSEPLDGC